MIIPGATLWCSYKCKGTEATVIVEYQGFPMYLCDACFEIFKEELESE